MELGNAVERSRLADFALSLSEETWKVIAVFPGSALLIDKTFQVYIPRASARVPTLHDDEQLTHPAAIALVKAAQETRTVQETDLQLGGPVLETCTFLHLRAIALKNDFTVLLIADQSERYRVEAMRRTFVTDASHELKTPVGILSLLAETIHDNAENVQAVKDFSATLVKEANRLATLVKEIFDLHRVEDPLQLKDMPQTSVDLVELARIAASDVQQLQEEKQCLIEIDAPTECYIQGEPTHLRMAVRNLLENALYYGSGEKPVLVKIRAAQDSSSAWKNQPASSQYVAASDQEHSWVAVSVIDDGPGIPKHLRERIFERFYRIDPARSRRTGGTGLGLAIVKHVAINHKGKVYVRSNKQGGSIFTILLPSPVKRGKL